jgi:hypothetical protein
MGCLLLLIVLVLETLYVGHWDWTLASVAVLAWYFGLMDGGSDS